MNRAVRKATLAVAISAVTLAGALAILRSSGNEPKLPNPNGYDDLVRAAQKLVVELDGADLSDYETLVPSSLHALTLTNAEALRIARAALGKESRVPVQNSDDWCHAHLDELSGFRGLMRLFCAAGRLSELEGRTNDALILYLDCAHFAHESSRGGLIIDSMVARVCENLAISQLNRIRDSLDAAQNRRVAKALEQLDSQRETWEDFSRTDFRYTIRAEFKAMLALDYWRVQGRIRARFHTAEVQRRQRMAEFALRAYELETGKKADDLSKLVPAYLRAIPTDPVTGKSIVESP